MYAYGQGTLEVYVSKKRIYIRTYVCTYSQISALAAFLSCSPKIPQTAAWPTADGGVVQQRKIAKIAKFLLTCTVRIYVIYNLHIMIRIILIIYSRK